MIRIDLLLVESGAAPSRTAAQNLIDAGRVLVDGKVVTKASQKYPPGTAISVTPDPADRFVSRGGLKMQGALETSGLDVTGFKALDVGQSTGGFTDCLLQCGAEQVVGVDVGHGQLHPRMMEDSRVVFFEGVNARALEHETLLQANGGEPFDVMVCDVSFISLELVLPSALPLIRPGGWLLSLVKPQFEVGREGLGRGGIVRDPQLYHGVQQKITTLVNRLGFTVIQWFDSPIKGGDGNHEFFVFARKRD